jgi:hypothetical protein
MGYAIYNDWASEDRFEKWENQTTSILRQILEDKEHPQFKKVAEDLQVLDDNNELVDYYEESLDSYEPMHNYIYPLETTPNDEDILKVALNTNCCIMYNTEEDKYYLSLTGCGMDLSQDIAFSYVLIENWIPEDLLFSISSQEGLSISKENFKILKEGINKNIGRLTHQLERLKQDWKI